VEVVDGGLVTFVPVRVNLNLKTETVEELLEKKKSMHVTAFEFRVNELRQRLQDEAKAGNAEARLQRDTKSQGQFWEKKHSVEGYVEAQVVKVEAVLKKHRARAAVDYSDDVVYRNLAAESLEAASMAQSALRLWLRDEMLPIHIIEDYSLLHLHRTFESFLRLRYTGAQSGEERIAAAVELCKARNLISSDANEKDGNGEPLLVALAARGGSGEDVELLVAAGADVAAIGANERSAIHCAGEQGHAEVIRTLARAGANCNQTIGNGMTPLWVSCFNSQLGSVTALLDAKADVNQARTDDGMTPLSIACAKGHGSIVEALLGRGADVNKARKDDGVTPLCIACQEGHGSIVEALLGRGADVNQATTDTGATPLFVACQNGHGSIVEALLGRGAAVNKAKTSNGATPLYIACQEGHGSIVEALLGQGADVNQAKTDDGATPLFIACLNGHVSIVEALLGQGADVNQAKTDDGATPLFVGCLNGHGSIVEALLGRGADVNQARTDDGATPLFVGCLNGHVSIVEALLGRGADVNQATTDSGATPLIVACQNHHTSCVQLLVQARADLTLSVQGWTPLALASSEGFTDIVAVIESGTA
jgi:ankyrin repeat protein